MGRILHALSQRPLLTGSGITLDALVAHAAAEGHDQRISVGIPADAEPNGVGGRPPSEVRPLRFGDDRLPFPVPGMSDVMPYRSTVFSAMRPEERALYATAWREHLAAVVREFRPELIHGHHFWIMTSLLREVAGDVPIVVHGHGTALRQAILCPELVPGVRDGLLGCDRFLVLHAGQVPEYAEVFALPPDRFRVVGAGYREGMFHVRGRVADPGPGILYAGKLANAKGLPELLDAVDRLAPAIAGLVLHVAGGGGGPESGPLRARMDATPHVRYHGRLAPEALADLMRRCAVFVLPSFWEGLPLVLVEAVACGCRLVSTALPGVVAGLTPTLGPALTLVAPPRLTGADVPMEEHREPFVRALADSIADALAAPTADPALAAPFAWSAVFERIREVWRELGV